MNEQLKSMLIVIATVLYVICPLDGDFIPIIGWLDDIGVVGLCIGYFMGKEKRQKEAVEHYRARKAAPKVKSVPVKLQHSSPESALDVIDVEFDVRH
jgi:uncharacterized membrane protein YkvA (DUF1232 family)